MVISKQIKLVKGMTISENVGLCGVNYFTIVKVAVKYATIRPEPFLPGIDREEKVLISRLRRQTDLYKKPTIPKGVKTKRTKK